ncbi:MAG: hypothetical protein NVS9B1_26110 [Candidatus Dormibacteraceae bacterium]
MDDRDLPDYAIINRQAWARKNAEYTDAKADGSWAREGVFWGLWGIPESEINVLPPIAGLDVIELGCGTAYFGARLKRLGARRLVGIDITPAQLDTARRMNQRFGLGLELIEANAEAVPLPDSSFDLAISEYGASIWCDPSLWIPEAARLLRPGGELVFLRNSTLSTLCMPDTGKVQDRLFRPQRGMHRVEWSDSDPGVEFHPGAGDMLRILRSAGFELLDLVELYAPAGASDHSYYADMTAEWAARWPAEEIWRARRR